MVSVLSIGILITIQTIYISFDKGLRS